eukprot:8108397-Karenia_brevis.AAC.1
MGVSAHIAQLAYMSGVMPDTKLCAGWSGQKRSLAIYRWAHCPAPCRCRACLAWRHMASRPKDLIPSLSASWVLKEVIAPAAPRSSLSN